MIYERAGKIKRGFRRHLAFNQETVSVLKAEEPRKATQERLIA